MAGYPKKWEKKVTLSNGQQVLLRPELSTDTEMLWEMFSTISEDTLDNLTPSFPFTRELIESWTRKINYDLNLPILALVKEERKQRIIGSATLSFNLPDSIKHRVDLGITVHDDYQNKGLGKAMISHLLDIARKKGLKKVYLLVNAKNKRAIRFYERFGFQIEGRFKKEIYYKGQFGDQYRMAVFL